MVLIYVKHLVDSADTADQGAAVFPRLRDGFDAGEDVILSFDGITTATSSFVNTALIPLLKSVPLASLKKRMKIIQSTRQINDMVKSRLEREARLLQAA